MTTTPDRGGQRERHGPHRHPDPAEGRVETPHDSTRRRGHRRTASRARDSRSVTWPSRAPGWSARCVGSIATQSPRRLVGEGSAPSQRPHHARADDPTAPRPCLPVARARRRPRTARLRAGTPTRGRTGRRPRSPRRSATCQRSGRCNQRSASIAPPIPRSSSSAYMRASPPWRIWNELPARSAVAIRPAPAAVAHPDREQHQGRDRERHRRQSQHQIGRAGTSERRPQQIVERRVGVVGAQERRASRPTGSRAAIAVKLSS